jgi:hypothetical protein
MCADRIESRYPISHKGADISPGQLRALRLRAQHLGPRASAEGPAEVACSLCGVNAQLNPAMMLSMRARIKGLEPADVRKAIDDRRLVRSWAMRGTLHLLDRNDLRWIVSLVGPAMDRKNGRRRLELGLDEEIAEKGLSMIGEILREPLSRGELADRMIEHGVDIDRDGQTPYHMIVHAALKGLICLGPDRPDGEQTYVLVDRWVGKQKPFIQDQALATLICRYLRGYGPACPEDFASWSGLSLAISRKGWEIAMDQGSLTEVCVEGHTLWSSKAQPISPGVPTFDRTVVNLLPAFDALILGYSDRELLVPGQYQSEVYHGGQTVPVILVDGQAAGVWRYARQGKTLKITLNPFEPFDQNMKSLIDAEVEDVGRFFNLQVSSVYVPSVR